MSYHQPNQALCDIYIYIIAEDFGKIPAKMET